MTKTKKKDALLAAKNGLQFLQGLFEKHHLVIQVALDPNQEDEWVFRLSGQVKALKQQPDLLSALTRLTQQVVNKDGRSKACVLDLEGHLSARRALLEVLAIDAAEVCKHTGKRAVIEGLNAYERRKVHQVLTRDEDIETLSEGEGEFRYMMVSNKVGT
jgi:predicted RNA-binding protein Jag